MYDWDELRIQERIFFCVLSGEVFNVVTRFVLSEFFSRHVLLVESCRVTLILRL